MDLKWAKDKNLNIFRFVSLSPAPLLQPSNAKILDPSLCMFNLLENNVLDQDLRKKNYCDSLQLFCFYYNTIDVLQF